QNRALGVRKCGWVEQSSGSQELYLGRTELRFSRVVLG
ncbi:hypothetical protein RRG08_063819, partial [Elysia crispata]